MADLTIRIKTDSGNSNSVLKGLSGAVEGVGKAAHGPSSLLGGLGDVLGKVGLAAMGAQAIFGGVTSGISALIGPAIDAQAVTAQLQSVLASTGGKAGVTKEAVEGLSQSLSRVTKFEDEAITSAQSMLLTFTNIGQDVFPQATETVLNMSQALGQDLQSSSVQLGKALNDPIKGITALSRVGVTFTEDQKEMIKGMVEAGDIAGAQGIILAELSTEFGGAAKAAGETFAGSLTILQNEFGNLLETIGGPVVAVLSDLALQIRPLVAAFSDWLPGAIDDFMTSLRPVAAFVVGSLIPALRDLGSRAADIFGHISSLVQGNLQPVLMAMGAMLLAVVVPAFIAWAAAAAAAAAGTVIALAPVLIPIAAIGAAAFLLSKAWENNWGDIQGKTEAVWSFLEPIFTAIGAALARFWEVLLPQLVATWESMTERVQTAWAAVMTFLQPAIESLATFWTEHWDTIQKVLTFAWDTIKGIVEISWTLLSGVIIAGLQVLQGDWSGAWTTMGTALSGAFDIFRGLVGQGLLLLAEGIQAGLTAAAALALGAWNAMWAALQGAMTAGIAALENAFRNAGPALVGLLRAGFEGAIGAFRATVQQRIADIAGLLPHSLARWGPLSIPTNWTTVLEGNLPAVAEQVIEHFEDVGSALRNTLTPAMDGARDATQGLAANGLDVAADAADGLVDSLSPLDGILSGLVSSVGSYSAALLKVPATVTTTMQAVGVAMNPITTASTSSSSGGGASSTPSGPQITDVHAPSFDWGAYNAAHQGEARNPDGTVKRAGGGPVFGGWPYWTGEHGPELFVPSSNGVILPNSGRGGGSAGGGGVIDYAQLGREVAAALAGQPVTVQMNNETVGRLIRTDGRRFSSANLANGVGGMLPT